MQRRLETLDQQIGVGLARGYHGSFDRTAERFARLDPQLAERAIREAVQKTFRSAARGVQVTPSVVVGDHLQQDRRVHQSLAGSGRAGTLASLRVTPSHVHQNPRHRRHLR